MTYSSVVGRETVRIALISAALNNLQVKAGDVMNSYVTVQIFSLQGAVTYEFITSPALTCRLFKAAMVKAIRTVSLPTTLEYFIHFGVYVMWPPATSQALCLNSSIFMS